MTTSAGFLFSFSYRNPPNSCPGCHCSQSKVAERGQRSSQRSESVFTSPTSSHVVLSPLAVPTVPQAMGFLFSLFSLHQGKKGTVVQVNRETGLWGLPVSYKDFQPGSCITCTPTVKDICASVPEPFWGPEVQISPLSDFPLYYSGLGFSCDQRCFISYN